MQMLYACENVRTVDLRREAEHCRRWRPSARPGFVEGTFGLECLLDELAAKLELDPLELRRRNYADPDRSTAGRSRRRTCSSATGRAEPHWARRDEVRARSRGPVEARRRAREPDLVRRRRAALVRVDARRLRRARDGRHGDAGHRHRHARRRWRRSPPRSSGCRSSASRRARRLRARAVRLDLRRLVDDAVDGPGRARGGRRRRAPDRRDRGAALRRRGARALARRTATSSPPTAARGRSRR